MVWFVRDTDPEYVCNTIIRDTTHDEQQQPDHSLHMYTSRDPFHTF